MTGDPAVEAAAVAALRGFDPLAYARADGVERLFADAVLARAADLHSEELGRFAEAVGTHVGNTVADAISRMFRA